MTLVLALVASGAISGMYGSGWEARVRWLDLLVIRVILPAAIVSRLTQMNFDGAWFPALAAWIAIILSLVVVTWLGRGWQRQTLGTALLLAAFGNTSFLGYPMVDAFYGPRGSGAAVIFDQVGSFLGVSTLGVILAAHFGTVARDLGGSPSVPDGNDLGPAKNIQHAAARVLRFPPAIAVAVGFAARELSLPEILRHGFELVGWFLPVTLVSIGIRIALSIREIRIAGFADLIDLRTPICIVLATKLLVSPIAVIAFAALASEGTPGAVVATSITQAAMPPMVTAGIIAAESGNDDRLVAPLVAGGFVLALMTVPIWTVIAKSLV